MDPPTHHNQQLPPAHHIQQLAPAHQIQQLPPAHQNQPPEQPPLPMNLGFWTPQESSPLSDLKRDFAYLFSDDRYRESAWLDISNSLTLVGGTFQSAVACEEQYNFLVQSGIHIDPPFVSYNDRARNELTDPPERAVLMGQWTERELDVLDALRRSLWGNFISIARGDGEIWIPARETTLTGEDYNTMFNIPPAPTPGASSPPLVRVVQNDNQGNPSNINLNFEVVFPSRMRNCTVYVNLPPAQEGTSYSLSFNFTTGTNNGN
ncbi:hypothetical protein V2J09_007659 [Rumex salicifolius]